MNTFVGIGNSRSADYHWMASVFAAVTSSAVVDVVVTVHFSVSFLLRLHLVWLANRGPSLKSQQHI